MAIADPLLLRPEEAAARLNVSRSQVYRMIAAGELPSIKLGERSTRVPAGWLERWVERRIPPALLAQPGEGDGDGA